MVLGKISHLTYGHKGQMKVSHPSLQDPRKCSIPYLSCLYIVDATLIGTRISLFVFEITRPSRWPIRSCCGSKLRATEFKSWSGGMLVIEVVPIQCSKLFKGMECAVHRGCVYTVLQTVQRHGVWSDGTVHYEEPLKLFDKSRALSPFLLSRYCHDCAESNVMQYSLEITTRA